MAAHHKVTLAVTTTTALAAAIFYYRRKRRVEGPWLLRSCTVLASTLADGAGIAPADDTYKVVDVLLSEDGTIAAVGEPGSVQSPSLLTPTIDGRDKLLLPGFVNAHTHSTEHLSRGLIPPVPLDLWVLRLLSTVGEPAAAVRAREGMMLAGRGLRARSAGERGLRASARAAQPALISAAVSVGSERGERAGFVGAVAGSAGAM